MLNISLKICRFVPSVNQLYCTSPPPLSLCMGAQWLSGRMLESRLRGRGFEAHPRHCVVTLSKTHLSLLSTGSTQEDPPDIAERLLTGM